MVSVASTFGVISVPEHIANCSKGTYQVLDYEDTGMSWELGAIWKG